MTFRNAKPWGETKPPPGAAVNWGDPISAGLVGRWVCAEGGGNTLYDIAGTHNVTLTGGPTWRSGKFGRAVDVGNATTKYLQMTGNNPLDNAPAFTVLGWLYCRGAAQSNSFLCHWDQAVNQVLIRANTQDFGFFTFTTGQVGGFSGMLIDFDAWAQYAFVYDGANMITYKNGLLAGTPQAQTGSIQNSSGTPLRLSGAESVNASEYAHSGYTDNVSLYRRALRQSEIMRLFTDPFADIVPPRMFQFDEASGAVGGNIIAPMPYYKTTVIYE
jgi:hypothetical protein